MSTPEQTCFSAERLTEIETLAKRYPQAKSALMPVLYMAQQDFGFLSMQTQQMVADVLGLKLMEVREVVTFYTMFKEQPTGKFLLEVCTNASCMLNGADELMKHMTETLGIKAGQTTEDGLFSLEKVACLGCCALAPSMTIDDEVHGKMNPAKLLRNIDKIYRAESKG